MPTHNGQHPQPVEDIPTRRLQELTYETVRARANAEAEMYAAIGALTREVSFLTKSLERYTPALIQAVAGKVKAAGDATATAVASVEELRLPSLVDSKDDDNTGIRELKEQLRPILEREAAARVLAEAEKVRAAARARRMSLAAQVLGALVAALTIYEFFIRHH